MIPQSIFHISTVLFAVASLLLARLSDFLQRAPCLHAPTHFFLTFNFDLRPQRLKKSKTEEEKQTTSLPQQKENPPILSTKTEKIMTTNSRNERNGRSRSSATRLVIHAPIFLGLFCAVALLRSNNNLTDLQLYSSSILTTDVVQRSLREEASQLLQLKGQSLSQWYNAALSSTRTSIYLDPGNYEPVSCNVILEKTRLRRLDTEDPNHGELHGKQVETDPKFWISLHNKDFDVTRWGIFETGHYYEKALTVAFQNVLQEASTGSRILDVGGNIGYFTLLSAAHGPAVKIDTFEPNAKNRLRLCESLHLNHWHSEYDSPIQSGITNEEQPQVNLYPYGVGSQEGLFHFEEHPNPGMGKFTNRPANDNSTSFRVISLDSFAKERGWFDSHPDIAILKVDVEGSEYSVIEGAKELLASGLVKNIFMEVSARTKREMHVNLPALNALSEAGYKLHKIGGFRGPNQEVPFPQDANLAKSIMKAALDERAKQLNLWWTL